MTDDPLLRLLERLPRAEPDAGRADRVRARCHAALARQQARKAPKHRAAKRLPIWEPATLVGLCVLYLAQTIRLALQLYGLMLVVLLLIVPAARVEAQQTSPDPWAPVRFLVGDWVGTAEGQAGKGTATRTYSFVLRDRFLHERNVSTYPPQEANKAGEVHEHWSFVSYDRARRTLVLRQFHQEGFVNQYAMNAAASGRGKLVFDSEGFENVPAGWRARETYEIRSADEFIETFELAESGRNLELYSRTHFKRLKR